MRADRSKVVDLFSSSPIVSDVVFNSRNTVPSNKKKQTQSKGVANANNRARMLAKMNEELFDEFNEKDWFQYFVLKAEEQGVKYLVRNYAKDYTIIKSLQSELEWHEIKLMIDFVWESNQDIVEKQTMGVWILSKGWINSIYQNSLLWKDGKYKPKSAPSRNREWVAEASTKSTSNSGLRYGKPIKDEDEPKQEQPTNAKRSKITLGRNKR